MESYNSSFLERRAFSLVEVIIALGVFAMFMTGFVTLISVTLDSSRRIINTDHAIDTLGTLDEWLSRRDFSTVYDWARTERVLYLYSFRASASAPILPEGPDYEAATPTEGQSASEVALRTSLRPHGDPNLEGEVEAIEGRLYRITLNVSEANPGGSTLSGDSASYLGGWLAVEADIQEVPSQSLEPDAESFPVARLPIVVNR